MPGRDRRVYSVNGGPLGPVHWGQPLPPRFRPETSERCIELPLAFAEASTVPLILDAGCTFNNHDIHKYLACRIVHVALSGEEVYGYPRRSYTSCDLRALPFVDRAFPVVLCISTLEHVGMDNRRYGGTCETDVASAWQAVRELRRVTAGSLMLSVPYGLSETHPSGQWRAFGPDDIRQTLTHLQPATTLISYYAREHDGWCLAGPEIGTRRAWRGVKTVTGLCMIRGFVT